MGHANQAILVTSFAVMKTLDYKVIFLQYIYIYICHNWHENWVEFEIREKNKKEKFLSKEKIFLERINLCERYINVSIRIINYNL